MELTFGGSFQKTFLNAEISFPTGCEFEYYYYTVRPNINIKQFVKIEIETFIFDLSDYKTLTAMLDDEISDIYTFATLITSIQTTVIHSGWSTARYHMTYDEYAN